MSGIAGGLTSVAFFVGGLIALVAPIFLPYVVDRVWGYSAARVSFFIIAAIYVLAFLGALFSLGYSGAMWR